MTERIQKTLQFLKDTFDSSEYWKTRPADKAYRFDHSIRVAKYAKIIGDAENLNSEALQVAALLHDISYGLDFDIKKSKFYTEPCPELDALSHEDLIMHHGYVSALHSMDFVKNLGFDENTTNEILYAIGTHIKYPENHKLIGHETIFTKTICNCDEIDHVSSFRFYEDFTEFNFKNQNQKARQQWVWDTKGYNQHLMEGLFFDMKTETAKKLFKQNIEYRNTVLENLQFLIDSSNPESL